MGYALKIFFQFPFLIFGRGESGVKTNSVIHYFFYPILCIFFGGGGRILQDTSPWWLVILWAVNVVVEAVGLPSKQAGRGTYTDPVHHKDGRYFIRNGVG